MDKNSLSVSSKKPSAVSGFFYFLFFFYYFLISCSPLYKNNKIDNIPIIKIQSHTLTLKEFLLQSRLAPSQIFNYQHQQGISQFTKKKIIKQFLENYLLELWAKKNQIKIASSKVLDHKKKLMQGYKDSLSFSQSLYKNNVSKKQLATFIRSKLLRKAWINLNKKNIKKITSKEINNFLKGKKTKIQNTKVASLHHLLFKTEADAQIIYNFLIKKQIKFSKLYKILPKFNPILAQKKIKVPYGASKIFDQGFNKKIGEISPIIKSPWGWHIYKILKIEKKKSLSKPYSFIKSILVEKGIDEFYQLWIKKQLKKQKILINQKILDQL